MADVAFWLVGNSETAGLLLQMVLVFGAAKVLAELFESIGQPGVAGELFAGILIGPSILNWVQPNEFLSVFSELGVLFLLFQVGLELKDFRLTRVGWDSLAIAVLGVIIPFAAGRQIMIALGNSQIESAFVGAAMVATSVGITAKVLADLNLLSLRASKIILAAAIIDDVLGLIVLAVVSSLAKGSVNYVELGITALLAVGFTLIVVQFGTRTVERIVPRIDRRMKSSQSQFILSILLLFGLSILASRAGVAAIIGAFLAGMALASTVTEDTEREVAGLSGFLTPFFLAGIGLNLDLGVFQSPATMWVCAAILVAAIVSKLIGCGLGAWRLGYTDALRVGVGMVPRGEVGMVVAQVGLGIGVIPKDVYGIVVFMSIATTIVAPPLLKIAYREAIRDRSKEGPEPPRFL